MKDYMNRETWLNELAAMMAPRFAELGFPIPKFRVAVGWTGAGKVSFVGGECWHSSRSADGVFEIIVAPILDDSMEVAGVLAHELTHAAVGFDCGHKGDFKKVATALGLKGPMTSTTPGPSFIAYAQPFLDQLGKLPHAKILLNPTRQPRAEAAADDQGEAESAPEKGSSNAKPKQKTRMLKACCAAPGEDGQPCGYTIRLTKKWAVELGACCPVHGAMEVEGADDSGGDDDADQ
jgi:hypothetical protein